jgi:hypothetical protein
MGELKRGKEGSEESIDSCGKAKCPGSRQNKLKSSSMAVAEMKGVVATKLNGGVDVLCVERDQPATDNLYSMVYGLWLIALLV